MIHSCGIIPTMYKDKDKQRAAWRRYYYRNKPSMLLRRYKRKKKLKSLVERLKSRPCTDCKNVFHVAAMQFDHVRGEKVKAISEMVADYMPKALREELGKCEVVCANCHAVRTFRRRGGRKTTASRRGCVPLNAGSNPVAHPN